MERNLPDVMKRLAEANEVYRGWEYPDRCTDSIEYVYRYPGSDEPGYEGLKVTGIAEQSFAEDPTRPVVCFLIGDTITVYGVDVTVLDYSHFTEWDEKDEVHVTHWTVEIA